MPFLSVPLKKTNEVDLVDPITQWMASAYSTENNPIDVNAVKELERQRNNAVCRALDKHESSLESITRYYDQLMAIENKIPFSPSQCCVFFKWKDAFDKGSLFFGAKASLTLASGGLERAAVLFNIGALASQIAGCQPMDNDEELKTCSKNFMYAAGVFSTLKDLVLGWVGQEPTPDLMPDTLNALSALMLAQAQEAIYIKAARDRMKPGIVAKIAAQASEFYSEAHKLMGRESLRGLWEKDALSIIQSKQTAFQGLAHYQQSILTKEKKEVGPELAHLEAAQRFLNTGSGPTLFPNEINQVNLAHKVAKKDNDFIYHERVPDVKSLPAIEKAALAKPTSIKGHLSKNFKDIFGNLIPVEVQQALSAYDTRRLEIVNGEVNRLQEANQILNGILNSLNLPAAVEDACNASVIPQSMREKAGAVRAAGGIAEINRMMNELPSLYQRNREILEETQRLLKEEKTADDELRAHHKEKWNRLPSDKLTEPLWQEVGKYRGILDSAVRADGTVKNKFDTNRDGIEKLSKPESELISSIPSMHGQTSAASMPEVHRLKELMSRVEALRTERTQLESEVKDRNFDMADDFMRALAESGVINEQDLSTEKLNQIFTPLREKVTATVSRQDVLASEIQVAHSAFSSAIGSTGGDREELMKKLSAAHDTYMELRSNLQEGTKFYNDLTPLLVRLQQKASDFCFARRTEKEDLLRDLGASGGTATRSAPPPRPPPPSVPQSQVQSSAPPPGSGAPAGYPGAQNQPGTAPYPGGQNPSYPGGQNPSYPGAPYGGANMPYPMPNPYGQPQPQGAPGQFYGQQGPPPVGYGQPMQYPTYPGAPGNPYGNNPYGQQQMPFNPYAQLQPNLNPFQPPGQGGGTSPYPQQQAQAPFFPNQQQQ